MPRKPPELIYGVDDDPPLPACLLLGVQHIFIIAIALIFPVVIVRAAGGSSREAAFFVSMSMLAGGIATILQALNRGGVGSGYLCPSVCEASYLSACLLAVRSGGLSLVFGMTALAGLLEILLSRVVHRLRSIFTPEVTGLVVAMVGIAVIPLATRNFTGFEEGAANPSELMVSLLTLWIMVGISVWGKGKLRLYSVLVGMFAGYGASYLTGTLSPADLQLVMDKPWISLPDPGYFRWSFDAALIAPFAIASLCASLKSIGNLTTCQKINDLDWKRTEMASIRRGLLSDGLGALIGGLVGGMGQSTSASNVGLSLGTGATSRIVAFFAGGILIALAFLPKIAELFVVMPKPVMGATLIYAVSFMIFTGFQIMMSRMMDARKIFVVGISLIFGLSVDMLPGVYSQVQHPWLHPIFSSSLSLATLLAVVLTLLFRIGISRQQRLVLEPGRDASESIFSFMERQGAAWGARKDVVYRAVSALNEAMESISAQSLARGGVTVDVSFDELNLDLAVEYDGEPLLMPELPPLEPELLSDEDAVSRLSAYLIRRYADRTASSCRDGRCRLLLHFDH